MATMRRTTDQAWCDDLLLALRMRDVPGPQIGEVLAEVQSHVAEAGEDPRSAFGAPKEYAEQVAGALGVPRARGWARLRVISGGDLVLTLVIGVTSFLLADGLWSLGAGDPSVFGLPAWAVTPVAALLLGACILRLVATVRQEPAAVVDPRTGADMVPFARWRIVVLLGFPVGMLVLSLVGGVLTRS